MLISIALYPTCFNLTSLLDDCSSEFVRVSSYLIDLCYQNLIWDDILSLNVSMEKGKHLGFLFC